MVNFSQNLVCLKHEINVDSDNVLRLQEALSIFLDHTHIFKKLQKAVEKFLLIINYVTERKTILPPFQCTIPIDLLLLHDKTESLYNAFVLEPKFIINLLAEIVLSAFHQHDEARFLKKEDIQVVVTLTSFPPFRNNFSTVKLYQGVLVGATEPSKFVRSSVWVCLDVSCEGSVGQRTSETTLLSCRECSGPVEEDLRGRDHGEMVLCKFVDSSAFSSSEGTFMPLIARLVDDIVLQGDLELGTEYSFIGVESGPILDVWNWAPHFSTVEALSQSPHGHSIPLPSQLSQLYLSVRDTLEFSPWAFAGAVVCQVASDILPISSCVHLKYGLLLSLASLKGKNCPVGVVAMGSETSLAKILMNVVSRFAERRILADGESLGGSIKQDSVSKLIWLEAGEMTLATNGVCLLGDWSKHKSKSKLSGAVACLENGRVTLESRLSGVSPKTIPLTASLWTYWGDVSSKNRDQLQLRTLIDVFGMPFLSEESDVTEYEKICSQFLNAATRGYETNIADNEVSVADMREFLKIITAREIQLSTEASDLIRKYFVASRRERPQCLPVGAIQTITSLAEAHTRLSCRQVVTAADVSLIIYLYQEAIEKVFGASQMSSYHKISWDQEEPFYQHIHRQMLNFTKWLEKYIDFD